MQEWGLSGGGGGGGEDLLVKGSHPGRITVKSVRLSFRKLHLTQPLPRSRGVPRSCVFVKFANLRLKKKINFSIKKFSQNCIIFRAHKI